MTRTYWTLLGLAAAFVALVLAYMNRAALLEKAEAWPSLWTVALSLALIVTLMVTSKDYADFLNYFIIALCGGALGWVVGILASPMTAEEAQTFGEYKTAIVGFLSGFAASKINDLWNMLKEGNPPRLLTPGVLNRVLIFFGVMALLIAQQYNVRQSGVGRLIVSAASDPPAAIVSRTAVSVTVKPGFKTLTLNGAASYPDMDVEWSKGPATSEFAKVLTLAGNVVAVAENSTLDNAKTGDQATFIATSKYNKERTQTLTIKLDKGDGSGTKPQNQDSGQQPATKAGNVAPDQKTGAEKGGEANPK